MGEENNIPWWQKGFVGEQNPMSAFQPQNLNPSPLGGFSFAGLGTLPTGLSAGTGIPESVGISSEAPIGNQSAQNTAQKGKDGSNALMEAWKGIQAMYEPTGGMPFAGSEDIRVKRDVYGRPYTTVRVSPTEHRGLGGELIKDQPEQGFGLRPGITGTSTAWKGPHSWEDKPMMSVGDQNSSWNKKRINPYTGTSVSQIS